MLYGETAFDAIFPAPVISTPTPVATPAIGFIQEGQSFGGVAEPWCPGKTHTRRLLATSTSRAFLSNVSASLKLMSANGVQEIQAKLKAAGTRDTLESIRFLVQEWPDTAFYDDDLVGQCVSCGSDCNGLTKSSFSGISTMLEQTFAVILHPI